MSSAFILLLVLVVVGGCATPARPPTASAELPALITERLALAREVARTKYHSGAPVHDPAREQVILQTLTRQATDRGLSLEDAQTFFTAQIEASRQVQTELLAHWRQGAPIPPGEPMDLRSELRPRLDEVTTRLLDALASARRSSRWNDVLHHTRQSLHEAGFSDETTRIAISPLLTWANRSARDEMTERRMQKITRPRVRAVNAPSR